jgi:hypothetical protein
VTAAVALAYQSRNYPAVHRRRKLKGWASPWMSHDGFHEKTEAKRRSSNGGFWPKKEKRLYLSMGVDRHSLRRIILKYKVSFVFFDG